MHWSGGSGESWQRCPSHVRRGPMASDSTNAGQAASEQDTTPMNDTYFTDAQGEDAVFGAEQLAQAGAGGAPVVVPVPQDQNVIRVQVSPGEILELSSPFDGGAALLGR